MRKTPHPALVRFGENVRTAREGRSWTQEVLATKADVDQTFISGIERGARNPTVITISKPAEALGIPAAELCGGIES